MQKVLSVAEKPSVAKELANIIGNGNFSTRNGVSRYNKIFEVNCEVNQVQSTMLITSVLGHVMELEFEPQFRKWHSCKLEDLFDLPVQKNINSQSQECAQTLTQEARNCSVLMLWLDCDLEGENISFEVVECCRKGNPRIQVLRARFSALIPRDIFRTLRHPDVPNPHMSDAVNARQEIDLRLGAAFTRFLTLRCKNRYNSSLTNGLISYGPCQFPTLGFVVDRYIKITTFVPEQFWGISCNVSKRLTLIDTKEDDDLGGILGSKQNQVCAGTWARGSVYDRYSCLILYELCVKNIKNAVVTDVKNANSKRNRPVPLNTIALQMKSSVYNHLSSEATMKAAESLYNKGIISYPRTETDYFKEGFDLYSLLTEHLEHAVWGKYVEGLVSTSVGQGGERQFGAQFMWPNHGGHDDQAHPPIHPTKCVPLVDSSFESKDEKLVYELVTRQFLACCGKDAIGGSTTVKVLIPTVNSVVDNGAGGSVAINEFNTSGETFTLSGTVVREKNYLEVYRYESWSGNIIPDFSVGENVVISKFEMTTGTTAPPLPISESELIHDMDTNRIGTDATIASHIKTIQQRCYVTVEKNGSGGNRFVPTALGRALIEAFNEMGYQLNKPFLRAQMELDSSRIARGEISKEEMLRNCLSTMKNVFTTCVKDAKILDKTMRKYFPPLGLTFSADQTESHADVEAMNMDVPQSDIIMPQFSLCGGCKNLLELRSQPVEGSDDLKYLFCGMCKISLPLPKTPSVSPMNNGPNAVSCPICSYQVLQISSGDFNGKKSGYPICPFCFSNPPGAPFSEDNVVSEFRCFSCANSSCPLSGRIQGVSAAGLVACNLILGSQNRCSGNITIRKSERGVNFVCSLYPNCGNNFQSRWLPKFINSVRMAVTEAQGEIRPVLCEHCSRIVDRPVQKIVLDIKISSAPPGMQPEEVVCACCDRRGVWSDIGNRVPLSLSRNSVENRNPSAHTNGQMNNGSSFPLNTHSMVMEVEDSGSRRENSSTNNNFPGQRFNYDINTNSTSSNNRNRNSAYETAAAGRKGGNGMVQTTISSDNVPLCKCNVAAVLRTTVKDGPNKGRPFYSCANKGACKFFQWAD